MQQTIVPITLSQKQTDEARKPLISISGLKKQFGEGKNAFVALSEITFDIKENEFFTLLGPSGCGKTTLLRMLAGFDHPTEGTITLDGQDLTLLPPNKRQINTVFQSFALFPHMTVFDNIAFGLRKLKKPADEVSQTAMEMLELVHLDQFKDRMPDQLSGGQKQRVALARALAAKPKMLLLDEPMSALDLKLRKGMQVELKRLQRETGITFVLVTHDQEEALSMSDRIVVLKQGKIQQLGTPQEIYDQPISSFVADFIGEANILPGAQVDSKSPHVAVRPTDISFAKATPEGHSSISGAIDQVLYLGASVLYEVKVTDDLLLRVIISNQDEPRSIGDIVRCVFPNTAIKHLRD